MTSSIQDHQWGHKIHSCMDTYCDVIVFLVWISSPPRWSQQAFPVQGSNRARTPMQCHIILQTWSKLWWVQIHNEEKERIPIRKLQRQQQRRGQHNWKASKSEWTEFDQWHVSSTDPLLTVQLLYFMVLKSEKTVQLLSNWALYCTMNLKKCLRWAWMWTSIQQGEKWNCTW